MTIRIVTYDLYKDPETWPKFRSLRRESLEFTNDKSGLMWESEKQYKQALKDDEKYTAEFWLEKPNPVFAYSGLYVNNQLVSAIKTSRVLDTKNFANHLKLKKDIFKGIDKQPLYRHAVPATKISERGKGYASLLLRDVLSKYHPAIATHIQPDNIASRALYESVGYIIVGEFLADYGSKYGGMIKMPIWYHDGKNVSIESHSSRNW